MKWIICVTVGLLLSACVSSTAIKVDGCTVFAPIYGSQKEDSTETMRQVDAHNAKGIGACGWIE